MSDRNDVMIFYTYVYLHEDGTPYYVGKGTRHRAFIQKHPRKVGAIKVPPRDRILLEPHTSEADALDAERFLIAYYGRKDLDTGSLLNMTDGGENPPSWKGRKRKPFSASHRRKMSIAAKKRARTKEGFINSSKAGKLGSAARWSKKGN